MTTIKPGGSEGPSPDGWPLGDKGLSSADWLGQVIGLASRILMSWASTWRCICLLIVASALVISGLWLLKVDVRIGPLEITGR
jgi:hypothetical protein